jgi:hypothetical protein
MTAKIEHLDLYRLPRKVVVTKTLVSRPEFLELLNTVEEYIELLRPLRKNQKNLDDAIATVKEMKFVGMLNHQFRQETYQELDDFFDDLYAEVHS